MHKSGRIKLRSTSNVETTSVNPNHDRFVRRIRWPENIQVQIAYIRVTSRLTQAIHLFYKLECTLNPRIRDFFHGKYVTINWV